MANQLGWILRCPVSFTAVWNGQQRPTGSIVFSFNPGGTPCEAQIRSHFGSGIITFTIPYLFRTPAHVGLLARGVPNEGKINCVPLEGLVETDWNAATFTMNWRILEPKRPVSFVCGEPVCFLQPYDLRLIESLTPSVEPLESDPALAAAFDAWRKSRLDFNASPDRGNKWQKHYQKGENALGGHAPTHKTAVHLRPFA